MRDFMLEPWRVQPSLNQLSRRDEVRRIGPKVMDLLVCLAEESGRAVSKEQLLDRVWQGAFTTDEALTTAVYELRKALDDDARCPKFVATVRGRGYRLVAEVEWISDSSDASPRTETTPQAPENVEPSRRSDDKSPNHRDAHPWTAPRLLLGLGVAVLLASTAYLKLWSSEPAAPTPTSQADAENRPQTYSMKSRAICSVVVLPLQSLDPDPKSAVVAQGISEQLANDLAQPDILIVVPGYSSVASQRSSIDLTTDAVVEGSVQRSAGLMWIRLQMVDAFDGRLLWGGTYQHRPDQTLDLQQELSKEISLDILKAIEPADDCTGSSQSAADTPPPNKQK